MEGEQNPYKYKGLMFSLLSRKANVNHRNVDGNTALHFAYQYDDSGAVAAFLIENGANDSLVNNVGLTCYDGVTLEDTLKAPASSAGDNLW